jgi:WD40 repeat protein
MTAPSPELIIIGHSGAITSLAFSSDGKTLVSGSYDQTSIVWDVATGKMRRLLRLHDGINSLALTPDGNTVITDDGQVWNAVTGQRIRRSHRYIAPLACSPDSRTLACVTILPNVDPLFILLTDIRTGRTLKRIPCSHDQPDSLIFSTDGELVASCGIHGRQREEAAYMATIHNLRTGETRQVPVQAQALFAIDGQPGIRLIAVSPDGHQLWNAESGELFRTVAEPDLHTMPFGGSVSLSRIGKLLAVGTGDGKLSLWNVETATKLWHTQAHRSWIRAIVFTQNEQMMATAGEDRVIRLWHPMTGALLGNLGRQVVSMDVVAFQADGESLVALGEDKRAWLWRIQPPRCERQEGNRPGLLQWSAPSHRDTARHLWDVEASTLPRRADFPDSRPLYGAGSICILRAGKRPDPDDDNPVPVAAISPDGSLIGFYLADYTLAIWNRHTRSRQSVLPDAYGNSGKPVFSSDNRYLAVSQDYNHIRLFDVTTGSILHDLAWELEDNLGEADEFTFSPDSRTLAAGHSGLAVSLWNVQTGKRRKILRAHRDGVSAVAWSPDGETLAIGTAYEETVWLCSLKRGKKALRLAGHTAGIRSADFSPDGTRVATGAADGTVRLWNADSGHLLATFLALPEEEWIIYTPEGHYAGSSGAEHYILWQLGNDLLPVPHCE